MFTNNDLGKVVASILVQPLPNGNGPTHYFQQKVFRWVIQKLMKRYILNYDSIIHKFYENSELFI